MAQNLAQHVICQILCLTFTWEKVAQIWAVSVILIKVPKVSNDTIGENSPNLVTVTVAYIGQDAA
jgi:hypothetical protein